MHPAATLFFDVCVQSDLWPAGTWPIVTPDQARCVTQLFALGAELGVRQGGVICRHTTDPETSTPFSAAHCGHADAGRERPEGCVARLPMQIVTRDEINGAARMLDREHAIYVDSGCGSPPDVGHGHAQAFTHLVAGVRDAVVFGAGIEYGFDRAIAALLRRRIRIHVALDAAGAADEVAAQLIVAEWKRRGVDGATVATIARTLRRA